MRTGRIVDGYDCLLLDLDGTVYRGARPVPGAVRVLAQVPLRTLYLTNNASRRPPEVAAQLRAMGFVAGAGDVVTSAHTAAALLAARLEPEAPVLVVGTDALADEIADAGLQPVRSFEDGPVAVVSGHSADTGWSGLAEAALTLQAGAFWVATNVDVSFPTERGLVPGNGAMVAALRAATGLSPVVAGKPGKAMFDDALSRGPCGSALVVGDRLDTDIAGANAAGLPSLAVLSGVTAALDVVCAPPANRPHYLAEDVTGLHLDADTLRIGPQESWDVQVRPHVATITGRRGEPSSDGLCVVRAVADALWQCGVDDLRALEMRAGDDAAGRAMRRWSLIPQ